MVGQYINSAAQPGTPLSKYRAERELSGYHMDVQARPASITPRSSSYAVEHRDPDPTAGEALNCNTFFPALFKSFRKNSRLCMLYAMNNLILDFPASSLFSHISITLGMGKGVSDYFLISFLMSSFKIVPALLSDAMPVKGYRRKPYIVFGALLSALAYLLLANGVARGRSAIALGVLFGIGSCVFKAALDGLTVDRTGGILERSTHLQAIVQIALYGGSLFGVFTLELLDTDVTSKGFITMGAMWAILGAAVACCVQERKASEIRADPLFGREIGVRGQFIPLMSERSDADPSTQREARDVERLIRDQGPTDADVAHIPFLEVCWDNLKSQLRSIWDNIVAIGITQFLVICAFFFLKPCVPYPSTYEITSAVTGIPSKGFSWLSKLTRPIIYPLGILLYWVGHRPISRRVGGHIAYLKISIIFSVILVLLNVMIALIVWSVWVPKTTDTGLQIAMYFGTLCTTLSSAFGMLPLCILASEVSTYKTAATMFALFFSIQNLGAFTNTYASKPITAAFPPTENLTNFGMQLMITGLLQLVPLPLLYWIR